MPDIPSNEPTWLATLRLIAREEAEAWDRAAERVEGWKYSIGLTESAGGIVSENVLKELGSRQTTADQQQVRAYALRMAVEELERLYMQPPLDGG